MGVLRMDIGVTRNLKQKAKHVPFLSQTPPLPSLPHLHYRELRRRSSQVSLLAGTSGCFGGMKSQDLHLFNVGAT